MRFLLAFVAPVATILAISELSAGYTTSGAITLGVALVAWVLLWRNLRDPEVTRKKGERARITFTMLPNAAVSGTQATHFGLVETYHKPRRWYVAMNRGRKPGDVDTNSAMYHCWVWLDTDGFPERVKTKAGMSWATWDVLRAVEA